MFNRFWKYIRKNKVKTIIVVVLLIWYYFCLPNALFPSPTSTVVESAEGELLGAQIADDGQWRFPKTDSVPYKFEASILAFEDAYFYRHPGFNPVSMAKAIWQNIQSGTIKRGGSTLTQQVIRLSRKGKQRTYFEKAIELVLATRAEFRFSKKQILQLYASHAPFGGNVVGIDMAAWRYFGRSGHDLTWAESATLAVLPNAPSLIYPGKNQERLNLKRNRLLKKLHENKTIDQLTYELSIAEPLPQKPFPVPQLASHLLQRFNKSNKGQRIRASVKYTLQKQVQAIVKNHHNELSQNQIHNMAVL